MKRIILAAALSAAGLCSAALPRDEVVETRLLARPVKATLRQLAAAQFAGEARPAAERFAEARRLISAGRASGDPRTLGYAEALLAPWPADAPDTPVEALVLHATIAQSRHDFAGAGALLDRVLQRAPNDAQALLTRATVATVGGDFAQARRDCARLTPLAPEAAAICAAAVDAQTGRDAHAIGTLQAVAAQTRGSLAAWALATLGDVHALRGEWPQAAARYADALRLGEDLNTRLALADAHLVRAEVGAAAQVLAEAPPTDGVLLRRWQIARAAGAAAPAQAAELHTQLSARLALERRRGEAVHLREAAWFALERGDAAALDLARRNWQTQREPTDLWLLARAARAAGDAAALAQVKHWLAQTGLRDVRVRLALGEEQ